MSDYKCSAASHAGLEVSQAVDQYIADADLGLWMVADGMSAEHGNAASRLAVDAISDSVRQGAELTRAFQDAHHTMLAGAANDSSRMSATVVAARQIGSDDIELAWVGNSRAYLYDMSKPGELKQLSKDHSYMQMLVDTGTFTEEDLVSGKNNVMTLILGDRKFDELNADHMHQSLSLTQKLLLCSDGLTKALSDQEISHILSHNCGLEANASALVQAAMERGATDNVTVIVIRRA